MLHIVQGLAAYVASLIDRTLQWKDIQWLRTVCNLPVSVHIMSMGPGRRLTPIHRDFGTGEVTIATGINR